ncbi:hypothetical protein FBEOM_13530 [Fusarium beomiforme]|uniref:Uncharacterized protein n=1 Tax=Fusarium beomiforme TaxID=44412 RepID=A0A9P5A5J0_9HYPO|nr:hypothetical protein FBEOM_13530 [Fusarium beomiforme]
MFSIQSFLLCCLTGVVLAVDSAWTSAGSLTADVCAKYYSGKGTFNKQTSTCDENYDGAIKGGDFYSNCISWAGQEGVASNLVGAGYEGHCGK